MFGGGGGVVREGQGLLGFDTEEVEVFELRHGSTPMTPSRKSGGEASIPGMMKRRQPCARFVWDDKGQLYQEICETRCFLSGEIPEIRYDSWGNERQVRIGYWKEAKAWRSCRSE